MEQQTYTAEVIEENGELMLVFPPNMLEKLGWAEGDTIVWDSAEDGSYLIVRRAQAGEA